MTVTSIDRLAMTLRRLGTILPDNLAYEVRCLHAEWEKSMRSNPEEAQAVLDPKARELLRRIQLWVADQPGVVQAPKSELPAPRFAYQR